MTWAPPANLATDMEQNPRRHMPTDGHTRKQPTAPTSTTRNRRKICRTCADHAHRKRPPNVCIVTTGHAPTQLRFQSYPATTEEHLGHVGKNRLPKTTLRPKLFSTPSSLPNRNQRPASANHAAKMPPSTANMPSSSNLSVVLGSETMPPRRKKTRRRLHRPIQRI